MACKKCKSTAPLKETLRTFKNGRKHIDGRCANCNRHVKFISFEESRSFNESDKRKEETNLVNRPTVKSEGSIDITDEYRQVIDKLQSGVPVIFVSGGAGTGKTTLIKYLKEHHDPNLVVVAPTGVAALNVSGVTIHSLFNLPHKVITDRDVAIINSAKRRVIAI